MHLLIHFVLQVKSDLCLTKQDGANLSLVYWITFSLFRIFAVLYIDYVGSEYNMYAELFLMMVANAFLVPFGNSIEWCLWTGIALIGIGTSSIWASALG